MCSSARATRRPGTCSTRGVRRAASTPTASIHPVPSSARPSVVFRLRAALRPSIRPSSALDRGHDRVVHRVAAHPQRLGPDDLAAGHHRRLGGAAAHVHDEHARSRGQVEARPPRPPPPARRPSAPCTAAGPRPAAAASERRSTQVAPPGTQITADVRSRPRRTLRPAQEALQHRRRRLQVGYDAVAQRVDHLDVLRLLAGQRVRGQRRRRPRARWTGRSRSPTARR